MIAAHDDWELGINPVTTGEAPYLPSVYRHAVYAVRNALNRERSAAAERGAHVG